MSGNWILQCDFKGEGVSFPGTEKGGENIRTEPKQWQADDEKGRGTLGQTTRR